MAVDMWRIEWWSDRWAGHTGNFHREYIEGEEQARSALLDLACQEHGNTSNGGDHTYRRSFVSWLRRREAETDAPPDRSYVACVKAWRLVNDEWVQVKWDIDPPRLLVWPSEAPDTEAAS